MAPEDDHGRCHMTILEVVMWHVVLHVPGGPPPWGWCQVSGVAPWGGVMCLPCGWCQVVLYLVGGVRWSSTWWVVLYLVGGVRCGPLGRCHVSYVGSSWRWSCGTTLWVVSGVRCRTLGWCHIDHGHMCCGGVMCHGPLGGVVSCVTWIPGGGVSWAVSAGRCQ